MARTDPSTLMSPPVGLAAGLLLWSRASMVAIGAPRTMAGAGLERGRRRLEHQSRHFLGHQVEVTVGGVDEGGLDVVLRSVRIGQGDDIRGDGDDLAVGGEQRFGDAVELDIGAGLAVVPHVRHPQVADASAGHGIDVFPVDVGGARQVDRGDDLALVVERVHAGGHRLGGVRAVVVDPPDPRVASRSGQPGGLRDPVVRDRVGRHRGPGWARPPTGRERGRRRVVVVAASVVGGAVVTVVGSGGGVTGGGPQAAARLTAATTATRAARGEARERAHDGVMVVARTDRAATRAGGMQVAGADLGPDHHPGCRSCHRPTAGRSRCEV